ncbi:hypothetical protein [Prosthecobacter sp.]|uniref:hypothetical protein n=1 Tax=Prosthecobacter sp. TaxID=1965333 RepID=UPI001D3B9368|nr:hypothetical protein [Prosthecobacter sp.]MCB1275406.1 hypothetical protein [Prosthecobacter sp.]
MIRHLLQTLRLLLVSALAGAAWVAHRPADLPVPPQAGAVKNDDMLDMLRQTAIKRAAAMEISEAEINRHLKTVLSGKVANMFGGWVTFEGARVDLEPDSARLFLIWNLKGHVRTASVDLAISRDADHFHVELLRGAYGHLQMPRGMMRPIYPALTSVAEALDPEIKALFQMTKITIAKDKLVLDPRFPPT